MTLRQWLMIDPTHDKVQAHGMPVRMFITSGTTADCTQGSRLIEGITAKNLLAEKGYDSNEIIDAAKEQGMSRGYPSQNESHGTTNI